MVITQADNKANQQAVRQRALDNGVRVAHESERDNWNICQLHPRDMIASFLEIEWDLHDDFNGKWMPAGGLQWEDKVDQSSTVDYKGVQLQSHDPVEMADLWGRVCDLPIARDGSELYMDFNNARIRFVEATDGRGPGLSGLDIVVRDRDGILSRAKERDAYVSDDEVLLCGTHWYLYDEA